MATDALRLRLFPSAAAIILVLLLSAAAAPVFAQEDAKARQPQVSAPAVKAVKPAINMKAVQQIRQQQDGKLTDAQYQKLLRAHEARVQARPVRPRAQAVTTLRRTTQNDAFDETRYDCDDDNPEARPGLPETCDGIDNDCDGDVDEGVAGVWYLDADGDGWGDPARTFRACSNQPGYADRANDCDDTNTVIYPGAPDEPGNGIDENCSGEDG